MSLVRAIVGRKFRCPRGKVPNCAIYFARSGPKLAQIVSWCRRPPEVPVGGHGTARKGREKSIGSFGARFSVLLPHKKSSPKSKSISSSSSSSSGTRKKYVQVLVCVREGPTAFNSVSESVRESLLSRFQQSRESERANSGICLRA